MVSPPEAKDSPVSWRIEGWCQGPKHGPFSFLHSLLIFFVCFELFLWELSRKTDGKVSVLQVHLRWKVQENKKYYFRKLFILIIPSSTLHNSKLRNYRNVGYKGVLPTIPLGRQIRGQRFDFLKRFIQYILFNSIILITLYAVLNFTLFPLPILT